MESERRIILLDVDGVLCNFVRGLIVEIPRKYINSLKSGAHTRSLEYSLSDEFLWDLFIKQDRQCALTGVEIKFGPTGRLGLRGVCSASLDRIDSLAGYLEDNVQWVHSRINILKSNFQEGELIEWARKIYLHGEWLREKEITNNRLETHI